jgi:predicted transcriptional regulator
MKTETDAMSLRLPTAMEDHQTWCNERHNREAVESWEHYQETGLHVTGEEVIAWVETWGTENEKKAPMCHL